MQRFAIAVDIGGTFTDFVLLDRTRKKIVTSKVLTTPQQPEQAIIRGIEQLSREVGLDLASADLFLHATTIITNAVIERKVSDAIMLYTAGFRDILEIGREHRYNLTDLRIRFPDPLSRRDLRLSVDERVGADGRVLLTPDKNVVCKQLCHLVDVSGSRSFAICFMHSYKNPINEHLVQSWIREIYPDAYVSCSSAVAPLQREYERWTTCTINASTVPLLAEYVERLKSALAERGFLGRALMMTSSGLPLDFAQCVDYPIRMIESGPAAGVLAAMDIASRVAGVEADDTKAKYSNVLAYDMGGTTAKGAFLSDGSFNVKRSLEVARLGAFQPGSGLPLMIPAIDLIEIGAGGGSIASVDDRGVLAVGPESAGADPGPACYDNGGSLPTLTDANVVLGYLGEENFSNSGIKLRPDLAHSALAKLALRLHTSVERVAHGIRHTVNESVARAFRVHAGELGFDYRKYSLVCTGGSAPLHAAEIARILNIGTVLFPFGAGVSSAFGLFSGKEGITLQTTKPIPLNDLSDGQFLTEARTLIDSDRNARGLLGAGAKPTLLLGMRYVGQGYEVDVRIDDIREADAAFLKRAFEKEYERVFGITFPGYSIEIFNWTAHITMSGKICDLTELGYANAGSRTRKVKSTRGVAGYAASTMENISVYDRYALQPGDRITGGALIEENDATIYLPPFAHGRVTSTFDIIAEINLSR